MYIFIVGIDHGFQLARELADSPQLGVEKAKLEELLKIEIPKRRVQFISEESSPPKTTIAQVFANSAEPPIPWKCIMMRDVERAAVGIKEALKSRPGHPDHETMTFWIESRMPEDLVQESFFIEQTLQAANGADSILMLLGDLHVDAVAERLVMLGHRVETNHNFFPVRRWEDMTHCE